MGSSHKPLCLLAGAHNQHGDDPHQLSMWALPLPGSRNGPHDSSHQDVPACQHTMCTVLAAPAGDFVPQSCRPQSRGPHKMPWLPFTNWEAQNNLKPFTTVDPMLGSFPLEPTTPRVLSRMQGVSCMSLLLSPLLPVPTMAHAACIQSPVASASHQNAPKAPQHNPQVKTPPESAINAKAYPNCHHPTEAAVVTSNE